MILNIGITILTFLFMEFVAWFTHKYIMHGFLWVLHKDHHKKDHKSFFEKNDAFFLIFAVPSMFLIMVGSNDFSLMYFWMGLGILFYGMAYFFVHDIFIHQRFKWLRNTNSTYLLGLRRGHKIHHKYLGKEDGECFGMLQVPFKYFKLKKVKK